MNSIESWDDVTWVFIGGPDSALTVLTVVVAVILFLGFLRKVIQHENHAYRQITEHTEIEAGPAVEGEPPVT